MPQPQSSTFFQTRTTGPECWLRAIKEACTEPDPARSNQLITKLHYALSEALADALGRNGGPNFHTWAVWGSRKAGETIRQEDLDSAIRNATLTAGVVGALIGAACGLVIGPLLHLPSRLAQGTAGAGLGCLVGAWTGKQIAIASRRQAAKLVLEGNRIVLGDVGEQSAHFLGLLQQRAGQEDREKFFAALRPGPSEQNGQDRLSTSFRSYLLAFDSQDLHVKREAMIAGNCEIVHHEHIRLEPYILQAMPFIIRKCATERMMTYEVGGRALRVGDDVPGTQTPTAAKDWTKLEERMKYIFALFRTFHNAPEVFAAP